jgi:hypothetical protein
MVSVIDEFNNKVNMKDVYEKVTGMKLGKSGNCKCPFHVSKNNSNAGIKDNAFSCFSHKCATKMKAYEFIAKYNGIEHEKFTIIANKINEYYPGSFKIYSNDKDYKKEQQDCKLSKFYIEVEKELKNKINERINILNNFFFDKQGIEVDVDKMHQLWNYVKVNELYAPVSNYVIIDDNIGSFKIDENKLSIEIVNRVIKFREKYKLNSEKNLKNILNTGKKIAEKYNKSDNSKELRKRLENYRFEYRLLTRESIQIKREKGIIKEELINSAKSGLQYLNISNIDEIIKANELDNLNKRLCELISEHEEDPYICGNLDYTISITEIKPFNVESKSIRPEQYKYIEERLQKIRKDFGSLSKKDFFCSKEIRLNKKINKILNVDCSRKNDIVLTK